MKWEGAGNPFFKGPDEGVPVAPGRYFVRLTLGSHSYTEPVTVAADPLSVLTQRQIEDGVSFARRYFNDLSTLDVMLNNLDSIKAQLNAAADVAKKRGDTGLTGQITDALTARSTVVADLTANYKNFEDFIQRPGKVREDIGTILQSVTAPVTPAMRQLSVRVDAELKTAHSAYEAYVRTGVPQANALLQRAGLKPVRLSAV